ncbi:MAG TPA: LuxR C-terminal-related transcriptional regulator [Jatrophihabitantaceae bacterium]|nr:LuxR C-terminal-related transcriptional regulator [Jatrophihabitantaceae bacterium]
MTTSTAVYERHTTLIRRACALPDGTSLFESVSAQLRQLVGFDGAGWAGTDPATLLPCGPVRCENVDIRHDHHSPWHRELLVEDVLLFRTLARARRPAGTLYAATEGHPARSARFREFLRPQGYGDELRVAFRVGDGTWGFVSLFRDLSRSPFSAGDVDLVLAVAPTIGAALRKLALSTAPPAIPAGADAPGTALYDGAGRLSSRDEQADRWFRELAGSRWDSASRTQAMAGVMAVLARAQAVAAGRDRAPAVARLRAPTGRWLILHASCLRDPDDQLTQTAVVIEPAKASQIAPIIIDAYCLTPREQQITQAVARGLSNVEIANQLHLSAHTVRDHLKATFAKVGVNSRGELAAKLFADHYEPQMHAPGAAVTHADF